MLNLKNKRGFTLIELLVVVAIVGLLSSVVLASLNSARQKARVAKAKSEIKTIYQSLLRYRIDNDNYNAVPFQPCGGGNNICTVADWNAGWLSPYIKNIQNDPWGTPYFWDGRPEPGYECPQWNSAICSAGPNLGFESWNLVGPIGDDVCIYFEAEC